MIGLPKALARQSRRNWLLDTPGIGLAFAILCAGAILFKGDDHTTPTDREETAEAVPKPEPDGVLAGPVSVDAVDVPDLVLPDLQVTRAMPTTTSEPEARKPLDPPPLQDPALEVADAEPVKSPETESALQEEQTIENRQNAAGLSGKEETEGEPFPALELLGATEPDVVADWFQAGQVVLDIEIKDAGNVVVFVEADTIRVVRPGKLATDPRSMLALATNFRVDQFAGLHRAILEAGFRVGLETSVSVKLSTPTAAALYSAVKRALPADEVSAQSVLGAMALACLPVSGEPKIIGIRDGQGQLVRNAPEGC